MVQGTIALCMLTVLCFSFTHFSLFSLYSISLISVFVFGLLLDETSCSRGGKGAIALRVIYLELKKK